jgi:hypothetical protein
MNLTIELPAASPVGNVEARLRRLLDEWFIVYNPLYFASALCFLAGVWLGSGELAPFDWRLGDLLLLGIVQAYELTLIGGAWLLWRAGMRRPATILLLLEALFFFDPTCEIETLTHLEPWDLPLAAGWLVLAAFKIWTLSRIFGVKLNVWAWILILGLAALIVSAPLLLDAYPAAGGALHPLALLVMSCLAALRFSGLCDFKTGDGEPAASGVAHRCLGAVMSLAIGLSLLHFLSWFLVFDVEPSRSHLWALLAAGLFLLILKKRYLAGLVLALAAISPRAASAAGGLETAELAIVLISAAFLLMAAGLAINLRSARRRPGRRIDSPAVE